MTNFEENELRKNLNETPKEDIIEAFIKLKKGYLNASKRLEKLEKKNEKKLDIKNMINSL